MNNSQMTAMLSQIQVAEDKNNIGQIHEVEKLPREERNKLFKDMLKRAGVTATWKWEDCERVLYNEIIWKAVKTFQEKRGLFNEYIRDCKTKEREAIKMKKEKLKIKYRGLLEEDTSLTSNSKFAEALTKYCYDERWRAIDEREREEMFQDYIDLLYKREEEEAKFERENKVKIFRKALESRGVGINSKWRDIKINFSNNELFNSMEKIDQLKTFTEYILELETKERKQREEEEKYIQYQNREKFRELLQVYLDKKQIDMKTKWKKFVREIKDKPEYYNLIGQEGSTPHDFFNDLISTLKEDYKRNKKILKKILKENTIKFSSTISYEAYNDILIEYPTYSKIPSDMKNVLYQHLIKKLKEKEIEHSKREKKIADKLYSYIIRDKLKLDPNANFEESLPLIREHQKFLPISDDNLRSAFALLKEILNNNPILNKTANQSSSNNDKDKAIIKMEKEEGEMSD